LFSDCSGSIIICNGVGYCCGSGAEQASPPRQCCPDDMRDDRSPVNCPEGQCCNAQGQCVADCANQPASINEFGEISQSEWVLNPETCQCEEVKYYCV
jgi:hypothetical protein